jgi:hypothetical protein
MSFAEDVGQISVKTVDGDDRLLRETWNDKTAVIAFVRHFG